MHRVFTLVLIFVAALAGPALAQSSRALSGTVRDTSGAALPGALVEALVAGRAVARATSGSDGSYRLDVPAGRPVALRVRLEGFADQLVDIPGDREPIGRDVTMPIGGLSDTLVVTAARTAESRTNVTQSLTVLSRADLHALGATQLADVLRFSPGASVEGTGREGGPASLFVRGGDSDYNVVLIDGVRATTDGGRFDVSRVAAGEIERVEIVRGAQSSLWGADAMTSVVQIFTRRAQPADAPQVSASFEGGSFDTARADGGVNGGARGRVDYRAGVAARRTEGAFGDLLPEPDRFRQVAFDGGFGATLGATAAVRGGVRYSDAEGRNVGPITYGSRDTGGLSTSEDLTVHASVSHAIGSRFTGVGTVNYFRYEGLSADRVLNPAYGTYAVLTGTPNAIYPDGTRLVRLVDVNEFNALVAAGALPAPGQFLGSRVTSDFTFSEAGCETATPSCLTRFRRPAVRYQGDYQWAPGQRLTAGYDWEREQNPGVEGFNLDNNAVFVQQHTSIGDRWFVVAGVRVDSKERYDTFVSPKLSAGGYLIPFRAGGLSSLKIYGNIGRGVKTASFSERFGGSFADANPDLTVEQSKSGDVGVEATLADSQVRMTATYFRNDFTDQISYRPGLVGDGIPEFVNVDGSRASGVEIEAGLSRAIGGFSAWATYALVDTRVVTNQNTGQQFQPGQPLLRRPKHSGSVRAAYTRGRVTGHAAFRIIGDRFDNSFLSLRTIPNAERPTAITTDITVNPGYVVAGVGVDVEVADRVTAFLRADNVGDTRYDSALGYPGLPRAVIVGARVGFGLR